MPLSKPPSKKETYLKKFHPRQSADGQLLEAAAEGDGKSVARLLAAGADANALVAGRNAVGDVGQTTALCAVVANASAVRGRLEVARLLLDAGADPNRAGSDGATPLMGAALRGELEGLRLLLGRGAAVDAVRPGTGGTAFHNACSNNKADCAEALARAGCDVGLKDIEGKTGREVAERKGHDKVLARLRAVVAEKLRVAQAAEPEPAPAPQWSTAERLADELSTAAEEGDTAAVSRLLVAGADPNASVPWHGWQNPSGAVNLGLGRIVALYSHASTLYQFH
jgi:ankyrin repeat protein